MDDDVLLILVVTVGEGRGLVGNLCGSRIARVVTHLYHLHALNDQSTSLVILHHDRRGIGGVRVAYAVCPGIGTGDNLLDGIDVRAGVVIGDVAKCCLLVGVRGEHDRRYLALGATGHGDAVLGCKLHGKGIAIGPIATLEHLLGAQAIKRYGAGAVVIGELEPVAGRNLSALERGDRARNRVAGSQLLLTAGLTAHEAKASRKHRLVGRAGHSVDDARQHVAIGLLALGGELAHAVAVVLLKVVHADGLAGLDGMGVAVLERKGIAHGVAIRVEHACLVALLGLRQGELKRKRQIVLVRILGGRGKATVRRHGLSHLQARHATIGILHGRCRGKEMVELESAQVSTSFGGIVYIC